MKPKFKTLKMLVRAAALACIAAVSMPKAKAYVYESNDTPGIIVHLTIGRGDDGYYADDGEYAGGFGGYYFDVTLYYGESIGLNDGEYLYSTADINGEIDVYASYFLVSRWTEVDPNYDPGDGGGGGGGGGGAVASLSLASSSGYQFFAGGVSNDDNFTFFNAGNETVTFNALDGAGSAFNSNIQWHVTDLINDSVIYDWSNQPNLTLSNLWGTAFQVQSRSSEGSIFSVEVDFADGNYSYGAAGDPTKIRSDSTYPYGQERNSSCSLGSLRNVLHIFGASVPSEDEIVQILAANGKPASDFVNTTSNDGMSFGEAEARFNQVLNPYGLVANRASNGITRADLKTALGANETFIVGIHQFKLDLVTNELKSVDHMIVMHGIGNDKVEILDPADGTRKVETRDNALKKIHFSPSSDSTGEVWGIEYGP